MTYSINDLVSSYDKSMLSLRLLRSYIAISFVSIINIIFYSLFSLYIILLSNNIVFEKVLTFFMINFLIIFFSYILIIFVLDQLDSVIKSNNLVDIIFLIFLTWIFLILIFYRTIFGEKSFGLVDFTTGSYYPTNLYILYLIFIFIIFYNQLIYIIGLLQLNKKEVSNNFKVEGYSLGTKRNFFKFLGIHYPHISGKKGVFYSLLALYFEGWGQYMLIGLSFNMQYNVSIIECRYVLLDKCFYITLGAILLFLFLSQILLEVGKLIRYKAQKTLLKSLDELINLDNRKPILFLRSFRDDQVYLRHLKVNFFVRLFDKNIQLGTLDELILDKFSHIAPLISIGNPNDIEAPIGTARKYISSEPQKWQKVILDLMTESKYIFIVIDNTEGVLWELETIMKNNFENKTILIFPPDAKFINNKIFMETAPNFV